MLVEAAIVSITDQCFNVDWYQELRAERTENPGNVQRNRPSRVSGIMLDF